MNPQHVVQRQQSDFERVGSLDLDTYTLGLF